MEFFLPLTIGIIVCLMVNTTSAYCENGHDENVVGLYGKDAILVCKGPSYCSTIYWRNDTKNGFVPPTDTNHTRVSKQGVRSFLHITRLTLEDTGSYSCWCYQSNGKVYGDLPICSVTLTTFCRGRVSAKNTTLTFDSNSQSSAAPQVFNVTEQDTFRIECHEDAIFDTTCVPKNGVTTHMGDIKATSSCDASCTLNGGSEKAPKICIVNIFIQVQPLPSFHQYTTASIPTIQMKNVVSARNPLPIIIPLVIVVLLLLMIAIALCVYIYSPKFKKKSKFRRISLPFNPSYNTEVAPTYAMVDQNSDTDLSSSPKIDVGDAATDASYTFVCTANIGNISDQEDSRRVQSSVVNNLYSKVDKSNETDQELGLDAIEHSPELYSEVSNPERKALNDVKTVPGENRTDRGYENVSDILIKDSQPAENTNLSSNDQILHYEEMDNVAPDGNDFAGLYAVVDKTKVKSQQE